jgi:hypothetical protein
MRTELEPEVSAAPQALLLLTTRGIPLLAQRERLRAFAKQAGLGIIAEQAVHRRRRGSLAEQLRPLVPTGARVLLVDHLAVFAKRDPVAMLLAASEIRSLLGLVVVSAAPREAWLAEVGPALPALGAWLASSRREQRREAAVAALRRARVEGRRIGRPPVKIDMTVAMPLVRDVGVERAAAQLAVGETTLRRALRAATPPPSPAWSPSVLLGGVQ